MDLCCKFAWRSISEKTSLFLYNSSLLLRVYAQDFFQSLLSSCPNSCLFNLWNVMLKELCHEGTLVKGSVTRACAVVKMALSVIYWLSVNWWAHAAVNMSPSVFYLFICELVSTCSSQYGTNCYLPVICISEHMQQSIWHQLLSTCYLWISEHMQQSIWHQL